MVALEHTLVILLLLVGLLNAKPSINRFVRWTVVGVLALAMVAPAAPIVLPWSWLSALLIPVLIWQTARRLIRLQISVSIKEIVIWLVIVCGIAGILLLTSGLTIAGCLMFGILAASMVWRAVEEEHQYTYLGQLGPLALVFLLAEIAPAVEAPGRYLVALFSGMGIGALIGYASVNAAQRISRGIWQNILGIAQVYLAYGVATIFDLSGIAAAMMSVAVYVAYGIMRGLWPKGKIRPQPLDSPPLFIVAVLALAFFAWQSHAPITTLLLIEIGLGLAFTVIVIWVGRLLGIQPFLYENSYTKILLQVGSLLMPSLLLWPREALLDPLPLVIALVIAGGATITIHYALAPLLKVYAWLDETEVDIEHIDVKASKLLVRDLMDREYITISPSTPVTEIARILSEQSLDCLPVVDLENQMIGIVTEHDLFIREEKLPRTDLTYLAIFKEPVNPELLLEVYAKKGTKYSAKDAMTSHVVWIKDTASVGQAVRLMVQHGYKCLPVLDAAMESGGKLVGVITRLSIIRLLLQSDTTTNFSSEAL